MINFLQPKKFPSLEEFQEQYGEIKTVDQVRRLQRDIAPYLLRRWDTPLTTPDSHSILSESS
jgi:hypothetical protein